MIEPIRRRDVFSEARPLYATCDAGLEQVLADELRALGVTEIHPGHRGVGFVGDREMLWRANLCLRVANRVLLPVAQFHAPDREALYAGARAVDWSQWFDLRKTFAIDASSNRSQIDHTAFASLVVKDALCDRFREEEDRRPSVDKRHPDVPINVRLDRDTCVISLDSSGPRLHRRGYRTEAGLAPLKETLAAGILRLAGWTPDVPLLDPMCGAGTFLLEAAMMARGLPPGLARVGGEGFAFTHWRAHRQAAFERLVEDLEDAAEDAAPAPIVGSDLDPDVLDVALRNAQRCGVESDVTLMRRTLGEATPPVAGRPGVLVINPPYGRRLGTPGSLDGLYSTLGFALKRRFAGWTAWVLVGEGAPVGRIGLRPTAKVPLRNGPIECTLLKYDLFEGKAPETPSRERGARPDQRGARPDQRGRSPARGDGPQRGPSSGGPPRGPKPGGPGRRGG